MKKNPQLISVKKALLFTKAAYQVTVNDLSRFPWRYVPAPVSWRCLGWKDCWEISFRWRPEQGNDNREQRFVFFSQSCHLGGQRYWVGCPRCGGRRYALYFIPQRGWFACLMCHSLRYASKTWSNPTYLAHHYERLAAALDHRPGPKPRRYWRYLKRQQEFDEALLHSLLKLEKKLNRYWTRTRPRNRPQGAGSPSGCPGGDS